MTNAELIAKIKAEIERRLKDYWEICFHDVKAYNEDSNVRELKELLSFLSTLESEMPINQSTRQRLAEWSKTPEGRKSYEKVAEQMRNELAITKDLEEVSSEYSVNEADRVWGKPDPHDYTDHSGCGAAHDNYEVGLQVGFKAGAKWQKEQMEETHCPRSEKWKEVEETARHEYENGWKNCKEQMMKDAVDGEISSVDVGDDSYVKKLKIPELQEAIRKFNVGDKVRIIIVKED